jgi:hypothetical protein
MRSRIPPRRPGAISRTPRSWTRTAVEHATTVALLATWVGGLAWGHGAARGLHLHVDPDPAAAGATVTVKLDASDPLVEIRLGFANGRDVARIVPEAPTRRLRTEVRLPDDARGTVSLHAEATTAKGETVRAAAIVAVRPPDPAPADPAPEDAALEALGARPRMSRDGPSPETGVARLR